MSDLFSPLTLPCGHTVPNRIAKGAMEENMADYGQVPGDRLVNLYQAWADGGTGMLITGNVMIDPTAMTGPGGVVLQNGTLDDPDTRARFDRWVAAAKSGGASLIMQISHPGRQLYAAMGQQAVSASDTQLDLGNATANKLFGPARALTGDEIRGLIRRFAETAIAAKSIGCDGVQLHAAHGYLLAQFLSPLSNKREDDYGGSLENRARFLRDAVRAVRDRVGEDFVVGVKLNSADFQKGGFDVDDAAQVVEWLGEDGVDFVEVSGGSYESSAMMGESDDGRVSQSTKVREAFFLEFAEQMAAKATMPLMVTGGITKRDTAEAVIASPGIDMVGIARGLIIRPDLPARWQAGEDVDGTVQSVTWKNPAFRGLANMALAKANLRRMSRGEPTKAKMSPLLASVVQQRNQAKQTKLYREWLESQSE